MDVDDLVDKMQRLVNLSKPVSEVVLKRNQMSISYNVSMKSLIKNILNS